MSFEAKCGGRCAAECGTRIDPGDQVEYVDDELVHVGCVPEPESEPKPRPVCPNCFMEIALNGACSC